MKGVEQGRGRGKREGRGSPLTGVALSKAQLPREGLPRRALETQGSQCGRGGGQSRMQPELAQCPEKFQLPVRLEGPGEVIRTAYLDEMLDSPE